MGAALFLILFILGILLSTAGGIIGLVEAFRVNTVWGLLYLFVPFAALVFFIKFWSRKWTRNGFLLSLAGLASTLIAFPFLGGFINQRLADFESDVEEVPIESIPTEDEPGAEEPAADQDGEEFAEPIVPAAPQLSAIASAELIQSTDPDERLQQVNSSRPDPYATVPVPPPPKPAPPPVAPGGTTTAPPGDGTTTATAPPPGPSSPGGPGAQPGGPGAQPGGPGAATSPPPTLPPIQPLPSLPEPSLAQEVAVSGVVKIGNENFAIVQSPTDGSSQYVKAGQRLANGQVLVKRIEVQRAEPVVVLEQNGIEVAQPVGSPLGGENTPEAPTEEEGLNFT